MRKRNKNVGIGQKNRPDKSAKSKTAGITLIALVVTIAILLILAGITIGALTGENGLLNSTLSAKEKSEIANEKEIVDIATIQAMRKDRLVLR